VEHAASGGWGVMNNARAQSTAAIAAPPSDAGLIADVTGDLRVARYDAATIPTQLAERSLALAGQFAAHPSLTLPWNLHAAESAGVKNELRVAELTNSQGAAVAYVAYLESSVSMFGIGVRMRETPGNRLAAYYNGLVAAPAYAPRLLDALAAQDAGRCDVLQFPAIAIDSTTHQLLESTAAARGWRMIRYPSFRSPFLELRGSWQEFLDSKSQNFRYNLKRKRKGIAKAGRMDERWYGDAASVPELIKSIHAIEEGSWKTRAGMAITDNQRELAYHDLLLPWLASIGALVANVLLLDDAPIAYSLCVNWHGHVGQLKTSFDERASQLSPGLVVTASSIEHAFAAGATEFDFLGDAMPHKMHWTESVRAHENIFAFLPTARGALLGRLKKLLLAVRAPGGPNTVGRTAWK
jgi:CelD/BcsL family acetyltransferase involved in cellulose biosynthesis